MIKFRVFYISTIKSLYFEGKRFEIMFELHEEKKLENGNISCLDAYITKCGLEIPCHWVLE